MTKARIHSLFIAAKVAEFNGQARLDNVNLVAFTVNVTDNGSTGTSDTISISLNNGYFVSGTLTNGDIRIH